MVVMISWCFDGPLMCTIIALSLSKPNPACARQQVPRAGGQVPFGQGISSLPFSAYHLALKQILSHKPLPSFIFHSRTEEIMDKPGAESLDLTLAES